MPVAWYIAPYKRRDPPDPPTGGGEVERYCAMDDFTVQIYGAGGRWSETEVLGNRAIVKVSAPVGVLAAISAAPGFKRLPKNRLEDSLADLSNAAKLALKNELQDQGYLPVEIKARFGSDLGAYTLRDVLRFMASRRRKPRYDEQSDTIVFDGEIVTPRPVDEVEAEVS